MDTTTELLKKAKAVMMEVYRAFGRPGEYGYGSPEGKALAALYDLNNEIGDELKLLAEIEAAMSEPLSDEEEASVERSWQRFKGESDRAELLAALSDLIANIPSMSGMGGLAAHNIGLAAARARAAIAKADGRVANE